MANNNVPSNLLLISNDTYISRFSFELDIRDGYVVEIHKSDSESGPYTLDKETKERDLQAYMNGDGVFFVQLRSKRISDDELSAFSDALRIDMTKETPVIKQDVEDGGTSRENSSSAAAAPFVDASWELSLEELAISSLRKLKSLTYTFVEGAGGQSGEKFRLSAKLPGANDFVTLAERPLSTGSNTVNFDCDIQVHRDSDFRVEFYADTPDAGASFALDSLDFLEFSNTPFNS